MTKTQRSGESLELQGGPLGDLSFEWCGDRYRHYWTFQSHHGPTHITSVESNSEAAWPMSPPLQQIHRQSFGDGREVVFGVGMAGRGHWSASFTLVPDLRCWIVELACKASVEPEDLVSTYQLAGQWIEMEAGVFRNHQYDSLSVEAISSNSAAELCNSPAGFQVSISPRQKVADTTSQWAFRLRV